MHAADSARPSALSLGSLPRRLRGRVVMAIVAVAAVLVPLLHCDLLASAAGHTHADSHGHAVTAVIPMPADHAHSGDPVDGWCAPHTTHCVPQVVLPARVSDPFALAWLAALATITVLAVSLPFVRAGGPVGLPEVRCPGSVVVSG